VVASALVKSGVLVSDVVLQDPPSDSNTTDSPFLIPVAVGGVVFCMALGLGALAWIVYHRRQNSAAGGGRRASAMEKGDGAFGIPSTAAFTAKKGSSVRRRSQGPFEFKEFKGKEEEFKSGVNPIFAGYKVNGKTGCPELKTNDTPNSMF
jgi:hypothetical protein